MATKQTIVYDGKDRMAGQKIFNKIKYMALADAAIRKYELEKIRN